MTMLRNERYALWEGYRHGAIAAARYAKRRLPDWYWDHWHILTDQRKDAVQQIIAREYPETAAALCDWRDDDGAFERAARLAEACPEPVIP